MTVSHASQAVQRRTEREPIRVLLVEDSQDYATLVRTTLMSADAVSFEVEHVERLDVGLGLIEKQAFDVMLLDLSLPDGYGAFTIGCACSLANHIPVIVLTGTQNDELAMSAVRAGAQEYLVKDQVDRKRLPGTILRAMERHRRTGRLYDIRSEPSSEPGDGEARRLPPLLVDPSTGLPNDLVFGDRLSHALARAQRSGQQLVVMMIRVDQLVVDRRPADIEVQDEIMQAAGTALAQLVRKSDTLARLGVDAFGVVLDDTKCIDDVRQVSTGLMMALGGVRGVSTVEEGQGLSASIGIAIHPDAGSSVDELVEHANACLERAREAGGGRYVIHGVELG